MCPFLIEVLISKRKKNLIEPKLLNASVVRFTTNEFHELDNESFKTMIYWCESLWGKAQISERPADLNDCDKLKHLIYVEMSSTIDWKWVTEIRVWYH